MTDEAPIRRRFVSTLSALAAVYGAVWAYRLIGFQTDSATDILKMSALIFIGTLIFASIWWRLVRRKWTGLISGALAGFLTAICIIPLPTFLGTLKARLLDGQDILSSLISAAGYSLYTFSLAEFLAIPLSMGVGMWAASSL